jgi:hypothetical protein
MHGGAGVSEDTFGPHVCHNARRVWPMAGPTRHRAAIGKIELGKYMKR